MIEVKPGGLLGLDRDLGHTEDPADRAPLATSTLSFGGRTWKVGAAS
jgi:hypothetical protein